MNKVPSNPTPRAEGPCSDSNYQYEVDSKGQYNLYFCLAKQTADITAGNKIAKATGIIDVIAPPNLLTNPSFENDFNGWTVTAGGSPWAIYTDSNSAHQGSKFAVASYSTGYLAQTLDLYSLGYDAATLSSQPTISTKAYFRGHPNNCSDFYRLLVQIKNTSNTVIATYDTGTVTTPNCTTWQEVSHDFTGYGANARYVFFQMMGDDAEYWDGNFGTDIDDASVKVIP